jgi:2-oxoglutarate dehydrogenase E2 component (dihydrolipoamide succinyltransferase)
MATNVVMPQMGESIAEGTIVRWIKKVGDTVDRDEPLFEISTDKVDAEIPSPGAGVLSEIKVKEGETVAVNSVVAVIGGADAATADTPAAAAAGPALRGPSEMPEAAAGQPETAPAVASAAGPASREELRRQKSSPLVRRIAKEHQVDIRQINGTGVSGRVTKNDILGYIESSAAPPAGAKAVKGAPPAKPAAAGAPLPA